MHRTCSRINDEMSERYDVYVRNSIYCRRLNLRNRSTFI